MVLQHTYNGVPYPELTAALKLINKVSTYRLINYNVLTYDKKELNEQTVETAGVFRSVVFRAGKLLVFSPPKSLSFVALLDKYPDGVFTYEEIIDGTMINLFYDEENSKWEMATKKTVGAETAFFTQGKFKGTETFRHLFLEVCEAVKLNLDILPKNNCYSFVFQHPKNRIVTPIKEMKLYLITAYTLDNSNYTATEVANEDLQDYVGHSEVQFPNKMIPDGKLLYEANTNTWQLPYEMPGVMVHHRASGARSKIRNEGYEHVRKLRGNQPKLQYQYFVLRKTNQTNEYLYYYPEMRGIFTTFDNEITEYTITLFNYYINCYRHRTMPLKEFPYEFRTHMYNINQNYKKYMYIGVSIEDAIYEYVNELEPAQLMFSLNYKYRPAREEPEPEPEAEAEKEQDDIVPP